MTLIDNYQGHIHRHSYKPDINFAFYFQLGTKKRKHMLYKYIYDMSPK